MLPIIMRSEMYTILAVAIAAFLMRTQTEMFIFSRLASFFGGTPKSKNKKIRTPEQETEGHWIRRGSLVAHGAGVLNLYNRRWS